jgi:hypothetical protein
MYLPERKETMRLSREAQDIITKATRFLTHECEDCAYAAQQAIDAAYDNELEDAYSALNLAYQMGA